MTHPRSASSQPTQPPPRIPLAQFLALEGREIGRSRWFAIDQARIDGFGALTDDIDPMHMDAGWCREHSPYGQPIAYGFLSMSMLTAMFNDVVPRTEEEAHKLNYGFDRLRLLSPVRSGRRLRGAFRMKSVEPRGAGQHRICVEATVEIEGEAKPALVADWIFIVVAAGG